jgi:hypothetical protein
MRVVENYKLREPEFLSKLYKESDLKDFDDQYEKWKKIIGELYSIAIKLISKPQIDQKDKGQFIGIIRHFWDNYCQTNLTYIDMVLSKMRENLQGDGVNGAGARSTRKYPSLVRGQGKEGRLKRAASLKPRPARAALGRGRGSRHA